MGDEWPDAQVLTGSYGWNAVSPQFIPPSPPVVLDLRFRRAMLYAINRDQLLDTLMHGKGTVAHTFFGPEAPEYAAVSSGIVRYDYDPTRAAQLLQELGYSK